MTNPNFSHLSDSEIRETLMLQERLALIEQQKETTYSQLQELNSDLQNLILYGIPGTLAEQNIKI